MFFIVAIFAQSYQLVVFIIPNFSFGDINSVMYMQCLVLAPTYLASEIIPLQNFKPSLLPFWRFDLFFVVHISYVFKE